MTNQDHQDAEMNHDGIETNISISQEGEDHNVVVEISYSDSKETTDGVFETLAAALDWIEEIGFGIGEYDVESYGLDGWSILVEL